MLNSARSALGNISNISFNLPSIDLKWMQEGNILVNAILFVVMDLFVGFFVAIRNRWPIYYRWVTVRNQDNVAMRQFVPATRSPLKSRARFENRVSFGLDIWDQAKLFTVLVMAGIYVWGWVTKNAGIDHLAMFALAVLVLAVHAHDKDKSPLLTALYGLGIMYIAVGLSGFAFPSLGSGGFTLDGFVVFIAIVVFGEMIIDPMYAMFVWGRERQVKQVAVHQKSQQSAVKRQPVQQQRPEKPVIKEITPEVANILDLIERMGQTVPRVELEDEDGATSFVIRTLENLFKAGKGQPETYGVTGITAFFEGLVDEVNKAQQEPEPVQEPTKEQPVVEPEPVVDQDVESEAASVNLMSFQGAKDYFYRATRGNKSGITLIYEEVAGSVDLTAEDLLPVAAAYAQKQGKDSFSNLDHLRAWFDKHLDDFLEMMESA